MLYLPTHFGERLLSCTHTSPPQAVLEAKSVSNTLDIPLYRAGDTIPRRASVKMIGSTSSPEGIRGGDGADQGNVKSSEVQFIEHLSIIGA